MVEVDQTGPGQHGGPGKVREGNQNAKTRHYLCSHLQYLWPVVATKVRSVKRAGSENSERGLSGGSFLWQPKMAEKRRTEEQTSTQEPLGGVQGEGGFGRDQGREDTHGMGRAV